MQNSDVAQGRKYEAPSGNRTYYSVVAPGGVRTHYSSEISLLSIPKRRDALISGFYGRFTETIVSFSLWTIQVDFCVLQISPV